MSGLAHHFTVARSVTLEDLTGSYSPPKSMGGDVLVMDNNLYRVPNGQVMMHHKHHEDKPGKNPSPDSVTRTPSGTNCANLPGLPNLTSTIFASNTSISPQTTSSASFLYGSSSSSGSDSDGQPNEPDLLATNNSSSSAGAEAENGRSSPLGNGAFGTSLFAAPFPAESLSRSTSANSNPTYLQSQPQTTAQQNGSTAASQQHQSMNSFSQGQDSLLAKGGSYDAGASNSNAGLHRSESHRNKSMSMDSALFNMQHLEASLPNVESQKNGYTTVDPAISTTNNAPQASGYPGLSPYARVNSTTSNGGNPRLPPSAIRTQSTPISPTPPSLLNQEAGASEAFVGDLANQGVKAPSSFHRGRTYSAFGALEPTAAGLPQGLEEYGQLMNSGLNTKANKHVPNSAVNSAYLTQPAPYPQTNLPSHHPSMTSHVTAGLEPTRLAQPAPLTHAARAPYLPTHAVGPSPLEAALDNIDPIYRHCDINDLSSHHQRSNSRVCYPGDYSPNPLLNIPGSHMSAHHMPPPAPSSYIPANPQLINMQNGQPMVNIPLHVLRQMQANSAAGLPLDYGTASTGNHIPFLMSGAGHPMSQYDARDYSPSRGYAPEDLDGLYGLYGTGLFRRRDRDRRVGYDGLGGMGPKKRLDRDPDIMAALASASPTLDEILRSTSVHSLSQDQVGCRFLQLKLDEGGAEAASMIFAQAKPYLAEMMTDPFGNYLFQKLLDKSSDMQRSAILAIVRDDLVEAALNLHGTRSVQRVLEVCKSHEQVDMVTLALRHDVVRLCVDANGNHVVQRALQHLDPENRAFIFEAVSQACLEVSTHRHGCCVVQRCLDAATPLQRRALVLEIGRNCLQLMQDPYGNYVVQYVLDRCPPDEIRPVTSCPLGRIASLSVQKYSSNVIEKCLEKASEDLQSAYIDEMCAPGNIKHLMQDQYANYVVQRALSVATHSRGLQLVEAVRPHLHAMRNTAGGRRILTKITKRFPNVDLGTELLPGFLR